MIKRLLERDYADDDDLIIGWWGRSLFRSPDGEEILPEIWAEVCLAVDDGEVEFGQHMNEMVYEGLCEVVSLLYQERASTTTE
jgi:hypothetical protein